MIESISSTKMLQKNNHLKASILDSICDMVFVYDFSGKILYVNDIACKLLGFDKDALLSKNLSDIYSKCSFEGKSIVAENGIPDDNAILKTSLICWDKSCIPVETNTCIIDLNDKKCFLSVARRIAGRVSRNSDYSFKAGSNEYIKQIIDTLTTIVEMRDPYTAGHHKGVGSLTYAIAKELDLPEDMVKGVYISAILHDIGKIYVPIEILTKPGKMDPSEMNIIKSHSKIGSDILKNIRFPWPVVQIVHQHHERLNGSGYPDGITSESILFEAKILSVADVVEAMSFHRPYRPALGIESALAEISDNSGVLYDPDVVDACVRLFTVKNYEFDESLQVFGELFG